MKCLYYTNIIFVKESEPSNNPVVTTTEARSSSKIDVSNLVISDTETSNKEQCVTNPESLDLNTEDSGDTNESSAVNEEHGLNELTIPLPIVSNGASDIDLNSLIASFDNSTVQNFKNKSKKSIMSINRFPNIKHQNVSIEDEIEYRAQISGPLNVSDKEPDRTLLEQRTIHGSQISVTQTPKNGTKGNNNKEDNIAKGSQKSVSTNDKNLNQCNTKSLTRKFDSCETECGEL